MSRLMYLCDILRQCLIFATFSNVLGRRCFSKVVPLYTASCKIIHDVRSSLKYVAIATNNNIFVLEIIKYVTTEKRR